MTTTPIFLYGTLDMSAAIHVKHPCQKDKEYRHLNKDVKKSCRRDKRRWLEEKSKEAQEAADRNDSKTLYRIVRELTNARSGATVPIKSKDGRDLLTDEEQAERWVEHFQKF